MVGVVNGRNRLAAYFDKVHWALDVWVFVVLEVGLRYHLCKDYDTIPTWMGTRYDE
jgi:hypothetical protein